MHLKTAEKLYPTDPKIPTQWLFIILLFMMHQRSTRKNSLMAKIIA